jgi:hypothetical protein
LVIAQNENLECAVRGGSKMKQRDRMREGEGIGWGEDRGIDLEGGFLDVSE